MSRLLMEAGPRTPGHQGTTGSLSRHVCSLRPCGGDQGQEGGDEHVPGV